MKISHVRAALFLGALFVPPVSSVFPLSSLGIARAEEPRDAVTAATVTLRAIYARCDTLFNDNKVEEFLAYEAPNYVLVDADGMKKEKSAADADFKKTFAQLPRGLRVLTTLDRVTVGDKETTAETTVVINATLTDPDGATHKLVASQKSTDVWVKNAAAKGDEPAMLLVKSTDGKGNATLDGKEIPLGT